MSEENEATVPLIRAASLTPFPEPTYDQAVHLDLVTDEGAQISFDMDIASVAILAMTLQPTLYVLKTAFPVPEGFRAGPQVNIPDSLPEDFEG